MCAYCTNWILRRAGALSSEATLAACAHERTARTGYPRGASRLLARGKSNREIGQLLGISARTVQNHVAHVYDKLGLYIRAGATLWAVERGLLV